MGIDLINTSIAFLAVVIAILGVKWATYTSPQNKRRIRIRANFLVVLVLLFALGVLGYYIFENNLKAEKEMEWIDFQKSDGYEKIESEIENQNYSSARKEITKKMEDFRINNEYGYIELAILKSTCYFYEAVILHEDEKEIKELCLDNCVSAIQDLLKNYDMTRKQMFRAKICLGLAYIYFNDELYFNDLKEIAVDLEEQLKSSSDLLIDDLMFFLGMYYEEKSRRDYLEEDFNNTIYYYEKAIEYNKNSENLNVLSDDVNDLFILKIANFYFEFAIIEDTNEDYLKKTISIYDEVISIFNDVQDIYHESLDRQGICYMLLYIWHRNTHEQYRNDVCYECIDYSDKAYKNFGTILNNSKEDATYLSIYHNIFLELNPSLDDVVGLLEQYIKIQEVEKEKKDIYYKMMLCYCELIDALIDEAEDDDGHIYRRMFLTARIAENYYILALELEKNTYDVYDIYIEYLYYEVIEKIVRMSNKYSN